MSAHVPGRRGSLHSRASTPSGRPARGGGGGGGGGGSGSDSMLPLLTGVLGSSILAFSLYVFSHKSEPEVIEPTVQTENSYYDNASENPCYGDPSDPEDAFTQYCPLHRPEPRINVEKRKWPSPEEEEILREKQKNRGKLQKDLKHHLRKVKELTEELERDEQAKKRNWRDW